MTVGKKEATDGQKKCTQQTHTGTDNVVLKKQHILRNYCTLYKSAARSKTPVSAKDRGAEVIRNQHIRPPSVHKSTPSALSKFK